MKYMILIVFLFLMGCDRNKIDLTGYNMSKQLRVGEISTSLKTMTILGTKSQKEKDEDEYAYTQEGFIFGLTVNLEF